MKQYFHGSYSNLISFFIGHRILQYCNDFHSWHLSISLQKWAQTKIKIKWDICKSVNIFPDLQNNMLFKWLFKFVSWQGLSQEWMITVPKKNDNIKNVKENWAHLAEKNVWPRAKITTIFRLPWKYFDCIIIKTFWKLVLLWASKPCYVI